MRRTLSILLAVLLSMSLLSFALAEEEELTFGDYKYILNDDGSASITGWSGENETLEIPAKLDGHVVTAIGDSAFFYCDTLTEITIPDSIISLEGNPFAGCESLTAIKLSPDHPSLAIIDGVLIDQQEMRLIAYPDALTASSYAIPQGVRMIGDSAFSHCESLEQITIPDSVTTIGNEAFTFCVSLEQIIIPDSVTTIGDGVFYGCESLAEVIIPNSMTMIADNAFYGCESLAQITIPGSITTIGDSAFYFCDSLSHVTIPNSVTTIADSAFSGCGSLVEVTIPDSITTIADSAFSFCESLAHVTIPDSVTIIGDHAFSYCESLEQIAIPDSVTMMGDFTFDDCSSDLTLIVGRNSYAEEHAKTFGLNYTYPDAND